MKKLLAILAAAALLAAGAADAARLGGGASLGRQVTIPSATMRAPMQRTAPMQQARPSAAGTARPTPAAKPASPWKGALMGMAGALGFMALAHMLGLSGEAGTLLMFAALGLLAFMLLNAMRRRGAAPASRGNAAPMNAPEDMRSAMQMTPQETAAASAGSVMDEFSRGATAAGEGLAAVDLPADFDKAGFLEAAKINYMRLQQAWCTGNVADLSSFTTEDVFVAITHQLHQRGAAHDEIACRELRAELLAMQHDGKDYVASVKFDGVLVDNGQLENVSEIWNLVKPISGKGGWLLAGIQPVEDSAQA